MNDSKRKLMLYEALELRSEYEKRIETCRACLPEFKAHSRQADVVFKVSPDFNAKTMRESFKKLEFKASKINIAIQQANFLNKIKLDNESITISEALEIRKKLNGQIQELHSQLVKSAYQRVIYKDDRDIVEPNEVSFTECSEGLEKARLRFRDLNRKIRRASFEIEIDFLDE
ncbi:hypothetical protein [Candidatus Uabimicrobium sp. HlEnr_7]|uniref:hypothetical protein n=1 Tax=Candidatus Uabimicrobium helgolandensis TaxID=3095367 RepID=UPI0035570449